MTDGSARGGSLPRIARAPRVLSCSFARLTLWLLLLTAGVLGLAPEPIPLTVRPAEAQFFFDWGNPRPQRPMREDRYRRRSWEDQGWGSPFEWGSPGYERRSDRYPEQRRPRRRLRDVTRNPEGARGSEASRPPAARKAESEPGKTVVVLGDSMAEWLAYGLEEAFAEAGELGVLRKARVNSSLIRNEPRDYDWVQGTREALANEKADFVVMMIGLGDRGPIRERPQVRTAPASQPATPKPEEGAPDPAGAQGGGQERTGQEQPAPERPAAQRAAPPINHEFRSERWVELYVKRLDEVMAALKAKRVPVLWVGLPPVKSARTRSELAFLNGLFKAAAEKAGVTYIDVWDAFVDEDGEYTNYGPDIMGQARRLRSVDGVHFTKAGARKLAHYVDRELRRLMTRETPVVARPAPEEPQRGSREPGQRPVAGPVVPLTGGTPATETLLGARPQDAQAGDPLAVRVLVKGEPVAPTPGRADNFVWPPPHAVADNDVAEPQREPSATAARPSRPPAARSGRQPASARPGQQSSVAPTQNVR